jgi:transcriptional regulator with XRE-family HTH domain
MNNQKIYKQFGNNVKKNRVRRNLSQEKLAELSDLHRTYIGGIERGERNLSLKNIYKIAEALNIKVSELFKT